jgi:integrase
MATIVERTTSSGVRKLYVVAWVVDRDSRKRRKLWELQPSPLKKDAARRKAELELQLRASGGLWPIEEQQAAPLTFAAYRDAWLADRARSVGERHLHNNRLAFRLYLNPAFEGMLLEEIRRPHVKALVGQLVDRGLARNTIRSILSPLKTMMREAIRDEVITSNPAADIEIPASAPVRPASVPTREELDRILAAASPNARDAIVLMGSLALRRGECFALRWGDIDFDSNLLHIHATNHAARISERTKTKAGTRLVPLFPSARAALATRKERLGVTPHPTALVFPNSIGTVLDPSSWARNEWLPALKRAGLEKRFHIHELRHFAATALDEQGMAGKLRSEIVGHRDEQLTNSVYTHIRRERVAAVAADFDPLGEVTRDAVVDRR